VERSKQHEPSDLGGARERHLPQIGSSLFGHTVCVDPFCTEDFVGPPILTTDPQTVRTTNFTLACTFVGLMCGLDIITITYRWSFADPLAGTSVPVALWRWTAQPPGCSFRVIRRSRNRSFKPRNCHVPGKNYSRRKQGVRRHVPGCRFHVWANQFSFLRSAFLASRSSSALRHSRHDIDVWWHEQCSGACYLPVVAAGIIELGVLLRSCEGVSRRSQRLKGSMAKVDSWKPGIRRIVIAACRYVSRCRSG